jgi:hypothetical protein
MKIIDTIEVLSRSSTHRIELLLGDLTHIPVEHGVDVLIVSAFPNDYLPTQGSLIGALYRKGLSLLTLAQKPEADLRENFSCWLSKEILPPIAGLSFRYVLCFEPSIRGTPPEVVSDIFRALAPFTYGTPEIHSIAMPVLAAGDQGYSISQMLSSLLIAATYWLAIGFPVTTIKLVIRTEGALSEALSVFRQFKAKSKAQGNGRAQTAIAVRSNTEQRFKERNAANPYDVFISYSRLDEESARHFAYQLKLRGIRVFVDRSEIEVGAAWQQKIFDALENCSMTAAFYSPEFVSSKVCKDEFNISWARGRDMGQNLIFPLLIRDATLPTYMKMLNYMDCRICDKVKIANAALMLTERLQARPASN